MKEVRTTNMRVDYICHSGNDMLVVNAARASFAKDVPLDKPISPGDIKLLQFLARGVDTKEGQRLLGELVDCRDYWDAARLIHRLQNIPTHWAPFGHPHLTLRITAPFFVRAQLGKHQVGFVMSEVSRRYITNDPEFFTPEAIRATAANVKQGSGGVHENNDLFQQNMPIWNGMILEQYKDLLEGGVCPEQARMVLTLNTMTEWVWTGSLYGWARLVIQRMDPHAQKETQDVARYIAIFLETLYPESSKALLTTDAWEVCCDAL